MDDLAAMLHAAVDDVRDKLAAKGQPARPGWARMVKDNIDTTLAAAAIAPRLTPTEVCGWDTRRGDGPIGGPCALPALHDGPHDPNPPVHNHGPEDGPGVACRERLIGGRLIGACVAAPRLTPDPDWERLYVDEAERYVRLSNDHAKCPRLDREARDYGLATIVRQYLRLDDALPDEKPDDMPVGIWDARVREVDNARRGVDAFLAQYAASQPVPTEPEEADR